jgi:hypothetical protein
MLGAFGSFQEPLVKAIADLWLHRNAVSVPTEKTHVQFIYEKNPEIEIYCSMNFGQSKVETTVGENR